MSIGKTLNDYQDAARATAIYPSDKGIEYCALGLNGEAGEIAEKVKKWMRDGSLNLIQTAKELGDVLWYCANMAEELGFTLEQVAQMNLDKLSSRSERGVLQGSGDNR